MSLPLLMPPPVWAGPDGTAEVETTAAGGVWLGVGVLAGVTVGVLIGFGGEEDMDTVTDGTGVALNGTGAGGVDCMQVQTGLGVGVGVQPAWPHPPLPQLDPPDPPPLPGAACATVPVSTSAAPTAKTPAITRIRVLNEPLLFR